MHTFAYTCAYTRARAVDIIAKFDADGTFAPSSGRTDLKAWQKSVQTLMRKLQRPRYVMVPLPEFMQKAGRDAFLPTNVGSHGLIQRCVLKAGSKTISETDDWNHLQGYHSMFIANERRAEREGVLTGRVGNYGYDSGNLVRIENSHEFDAANNQTMHAYQNLDKQPTWQVTLSELFPFLKQIQLPLYCMKDQLSIEIHFAPQSQRYWLRKSEVGVVRLRLRLRLQSLWMW